MSSLFFRANQSVNTWLLWSTNLGVSRWTLRRFHFCQSFVQIGLLPHFVQIRLNFWRRDCRHLRFLQTTNQKWKIWRVICKNQRFINRVPYFSYFTKTHFSLILPIFATFGHSPYHSQQFDKWSSHSQIFDNKLR